MANIKFSDFTAFGSNPVDASSGLVAYKGTDNIQFTPAELAPLTGLYAANGTLAGNRTITMDGNTLSMSSPGGNTVTFGGANNSGMAITGGNNYIVSFNGTYAISSIATSTSDAIVLRTSANASADTSILIDSRSPGANADLHLKTATKLKIDLPVAATVGYVLKADDIDGNVSWGPETDTGVTGVTLTTGTGQTLPLAESITNRELTLTSNKYGGTNQVGYVPEGGTNTTFLRGDGTWVTPTDTNTNIANTDLILNASRTLGLDANQNLTFTGSGTSKVTFSNLGGVEIARDLTVQKNVIIQGQGYSELHTGADISSIDWNLGNVQEITLASGEADFDPSNAKAGATYILKITQPSGGDGIINWDNIGAANIKWPGGTEPTLTATNAAIDIVTLICTSATGQGVYYANATLNFS